MADEKKTYLINIESNLKEYIDELIKAKEKLADAKKAVEDLKNGQFKSREEIELTNAAFRNAKKEVGDLTKVVDKLTTASKSDASEREKLNAIIAIELQRLKALGNGYTTNAAGLRIVNPEYIKQKQNLKEANAALIQYDLSLKSGKTNVGLYGDSVTAAFASAGKSMLSMISPMALITAGIALAKKVFEGFKEAIMSTTGAINAVNIVGSILKQMFYDVAINGRLSAESMRQVAAAAAELNKLRTEEYKESFEISKINREEQAVRELSIDRTRTHAERLESLTKVKDLESQKTKIQVGHLQKELEANLRIMEQRPKDEKQRQKVWEIMTKINDVYAAEDQAMRRVETQRTGFIQEEIDGRKKLFDAYLVEIEKTNEANDKARAKEKAEAEKDEIERLKRIHKQIEDEQEERGRLGLDEMQRLAKKYQDKQEKEKRDTEAGFEYQRLKAGENVDLLQQILDAEYGAMLASVDYKNLTTNEKLLIDQQYTENTKQLSLLRMSQDVQELNLVANIMSSLSGLFGKQTIAAKALSVSQALISTYTAGVKAMAELPLGSGPVLRFLTLAAVIAAGLIQVKNILAVKVPGGGGGESGVGISAPTAITTSIPAQKTFATPVGSTILTQPQLSQTQLNALPQNLLTADDIAKAVSKLPAPRVSVEDINVKMNEVKKVKVRADI